VSVPIQIADADWQHVQQILQDKLPQMEVWAFGSRARRSAKTYSDLDLALISDEPISLARMADIASAFEESDLSVRVDIADWASCSPNFRDIIATDKVVVQLAAPRDAPTVPTPPS
jgi:type I restriction enzyme S subunit